jgi:hypothetical protein
LAARSESRKTELGGEVLYWYKVPDVFLGKGCPYTGTSFLLMEDAII